MVFDAPIIFFENICPQFEAEYLSETFSAEMEFCKIDPWRSCETPSARSSSPSSPSSPSSWS
jgi:hypothetical protein